MGWEGHKNGFAPMQLQKVKEAYTHIGVVRCESIVYPAKLEATVSIQQNVVEGSEQITESVEVRVS